MQCKNISRDTIPVMLKLINDTIAKHQDVYDRLVIRKLVKKAGMQKCIDTVFTLLTHGSTPSRYSVISPRFHSQSSVSTIFWNNNTNNTNAKWSLLNAFGLNRSLSSTSDDVVSPSPKADPDVT